MPKINTKAWISEKQGPDYEPTQPTGYFYLFTGGYEVKNGKPKRVGDDEGPAGHVAFSTRTGTWEIKVQDRTKANFRIVRWTLKNRTLPGLTFDPAPDTELKPTKKLTIDVDNVPTGHKYKFDEFGVTLENDAGKRVELDPRVYDIR